MSKTYDGMMDKLVHDIKHHRALYTHGQPEISDAEFDQLIQQVRDLDPDHPILKEVGAPVERNSSLQRVKLTRRMGSLNNAMTQEAFQKWWKKVRPSGVVVQQKLDGLSLELTYKGGLLAQAVTRGDGVEGEDVWHTVANIADIPKKLKSDGGKDTKVVRGEVLVARSMMASLPDYSNPRNAAAGLLRRKDGSGAKYLTFRAFSYWKKNSDMQTESSKLGYLRSNGFQTATSYNCSEYTEVIKVWQQIEEERDSTAPFDMDGTVVKINDCAYQAEVQEAAGLDEQDDPAWAVAFKWVEKPVVTTLKGVELSVGRTGVITPVALLKPVTIGGVVVKRASLCNWEEVERLQIWIGNEVKVIRSGEVIPKVIGNACKVMSGEKIVRPAKCPSCGGSTDEDGPRQVCLNSDCPAQVAGKIENWCKKRDILGLGPAQIDKLVACDNDSIIDLYKMSEQNWIDALESEAVGAKVYKEVQHSRKCTLAEFVGSVGIEGLGRREMVMLMEKTGADTLEKVLHLTYKDLLKLPGYQKTKAMKIVDGLDAYTEVLNDLEVYMKIEAPAEVTGDDNAGKVVCFTGVRPTGDEEQQFVASGGKVASGVSKNITHLVQKDASSNSSKSEKAKALGVKVIGYAEFKSWL
jgi:DNA ligase (NAD+)